MLILFISLLFLGLSLSLSRPLFKGNYFNPLLIFFSVWFVVMFFYFLDSYFFHYFYVRLSSQAEKVLFLSHLFFFLGCLSAALIREGSGKITQVSRLSRKNIDALRLLEKITKILLVLTFAGLFLKYVQVTSTYGLNIFNNLELIREGVTKYNFRLKPLSRLLTLMNYNVFLNLGILLVFSKRKKILMLLLLAFLASFFNDLTVGGRGSTFTNILFIVSSFFLSLIIKHRKLKIKTLLWGAITILLIIAVLSSVVYLRSGRKSSFFYLIFNYNYAYIAGLPSSFSYHIDHPYPSNLFAHNTLRGFYELLNNVAAIFNYKLFPEDTFASQYAKITTGPFNSTTFHIPVYSDFGTSGLIFFSYLFGFFSSFFFLKTILKRNLLSPNHIFHLQIAAILISSIVFSPRGLFTQGMAIWITILILILQTSIMQSKQKIPVGKRAT